MVTNATAPGTFEGYSRLHVAVLVTVLLQLVVLSVKIWMNREELKVSLSTIVLMFITLAFIVLPSVLLNLYNSRCLYFLAGQNSNCSMLGVIVAVSTMIGAMFGLVGVWQMDVAEELSLKNQEGRSVSSD